MAVRVAMTRLLAWQCNVSGGGSFGLIMVMVKVFEWCYGEDCGGRRIMVRVACWLLSIVNRGMAGMWTMYL